jgi:hypothetical protein
VNSLPDNMWEFLGLLVVTALQAYSIWQQRSINMNQQGLHKQLNSLTDARVLVAGQAAHAEGMIAGAAGEQDRIARMIAAQVAIEVAKRLEESGTPAIKVKTVGAE